MAPKGAILAGACARLARGREDEDGLFDIRVHGLEVRRACTNPNPRALQCLRALTTSSRCRPVCASAHSGAVGASAVTESVSCTGGCGPSSDAQCAVVRAAVRVRAMPSRDAVGGQWAGGKTGARAGLTDFGRGLQHSGNVPQVHHALHEVSACAWACRLPAACTHTHPRAHPRAHSHMHLDTETRTYRRACAYVCLCLCTDEAQMKTTAAKRMRCTVAVQSPLVGVVGQQQRLRRQPHAKVCIGAWHRRCLQQEAARINK